MKYDNVVCVENPAEVVLPLYQPLRLWNSRPVRTRSCEKKPDKIRGGVQNPIRVFSIRGRYINVPGGERKLVIAGKIFSRNGR